MKVRVREDQGGVHEKKKDTCFVFETHTGGYCTSGFKINDPNLSATNAACDTYSSVTYLVSY